MTPLYIGPDGKHPEPVRRFFVGLDLGQAQDPTALVVTERLDPLGHGNPHFEIPYLKRFPLGTPYTAIAANARALLQTDVLCGRTQLVADATGVGAPVIDLLREQSLSPIAVTITGGDTVTKDGSAYRIPKRDLISNLQVLLQAGRLKIADAIPEALVLVEELLAYRVKITANAHDVYEPWREGAHDDLLLAVALACWYGETYVVPAAATVRSALMRSYEWDRW